VRDQRKKTMARRTGLSKVPTGIAGLDEITEGGLPRGRPTLIAGQAGSGKTMLAMEFLVRNALKSGEPGVFVSFEESPPDLIVNFASLGFDLEGLIHRKMLAIEHVSMSDFPVVETGGYNLDGLFIRLEHVIKGIGAKHVVLDPVGMLFAQLSNVPFVRLELVRLFQWLKSLGVTTIITSEREGIASLGGLESYACDCVIHMGNRVEDSVSTRWLRVAKYRGSRHASDVFPFYIGESGLSVLPITSVMPNYEAATEKITTGVARLDAQLGGGYYRWSSILVTGDAGTGKTSLAASFAQATCRRGERCLYLAFEEAKNQVVRNMRSIGIDLAPHIKKGLLDFRTFRPTLYGLETHLVVIKKLIEDFQPSVVIVDPISNLQDIGTERDTKSMLSRLVDFMKTKKITSFFTNLRPSTEIGTELGVSSVMDVWVSLRMVESNGEHNRLLTVIKARGMAHSNQVREFVLTDSGIQLLDVYVGPSGVLTGSARVALEERERMEKVESEREHRRRQRELKGKKLEIETRMAALKVEIADIQEELDREASEKKANGRAASEASKRMARMRRADKLAGSQASV
jgi:circadian clock protein KaiC